MNNSRFRDPLPLPSHIHYELLLQLLERKTLVLAKQPVLREQVQQLIITLRKAMAQQKQLETACDQTRIPYEYYWALNNSELKPEETVKISSSPQEVTVVLGGKSEIL